MPTNEERSKVAARLKEIDTSRLYDGIDEICALEDACGCGVGQDWQDMELKDRLAELIEPEPERTCEILSFDNGLDEDYDGSIYSYAPPTYYLSCEHEAYYLKPNYCPECRAKVVEK